jgi:hypothetical protein
MHSFFTLRRIFIFSICLTGFFWGCTRIGVTDIGGGLIPNIDGVATFDTLMDVVTDNFDDPDTARIYKADNHLLGAINNDPLFGKTKASMYFELKPNAYPFYFPGEKDSLKVDSAVLILSYKGMYGDSTVPLTLNVSEISQNTHLDPTLTYPSNYPNTIPISTGAALANPITLDIRRLADSVNNRFENATHQIRIRLFDKVANRFIKGYDSTNAYLSDSTFKTYFAGFAVTTNPGAAGNALLKINMGDTNTKFALYFSSSSTGATKRDTSVAYFNFSYFVSGDANFVTRDRTGSEVAKHFTTTSKPDSLVYVQTSPGTYVRVRVPGLRNLSNRIIHRAELIAEQVPDDANLTTLETKMLPPRYLLLSIYDSAIKTKRNIPNDYILGQSGPNIESFGGFLSYKTLLGYDRVAAYTFNLSRYVQGIVTRKDSSYTMRISAPANDSLMYTGPYPLNKTSQLNYLTPTVGNDPGEGRVRLGGGTNTRFRMRLRIVFSRI